MPDRSFFCHLLHIFAGFARPAAGRSFSKAKEGLDPSPGCLLLPQPVLPLNYIAQGRGVQDTTPQLLNYSPDCYRG